MAIIEWLIKGLPILSRILKASNRPELIVFFGDRDINNDGLVIENISGATAYEVKIKDGFDRIKKACYNSQTVYGTQPDRFVPVTNYTHLIRINHKRIYRFFYEDLEDLSPIDISIEYKNVKGKKFKQKFPEVSYYREGFLRSEHEDFIHHLRSYSEALVSILASQHGRNPHLASLVKRIATDEFMTSLLKSELIPTEEVERTLNLLLSTGFINSFSIEIDGKGKTVKVSNDNLL